MIVLLSSADGRTTPLVAGVGIAACLTKPVKQAELMDAILMVLDGSPDARPRPPGRDRRPWPDRARRSGELSVLLVEDNATNQLLAEALLERKGHAVVTARNGKEALAALAGRSFDVVLMDVQMPEMDGFEATARIRAEERGTGRARPHHRHDGPRDEGRSRRCLAAGMDGYVTKPIRADELYGHGFVHAGGYPGSPPCGGEQPGRPPRGRTGLLPAGTPAGVLDKAALLARVGGREDRLRAIVQVFQGESAGLMAEMWEAIAGGRADGLKRAAHSLKGAAGLFGAAGVVENALRLESLGQAGELTGAMESYGKLEEEIPKLNSALADLLSCSPEPPR